jgi:hypothetical protein
VSKIVKIIAQIDWPVENSKNHPTHRVTSVSMAPALELLACHQVFAHVPVFTEQTGLEEQSGSSGISRKHCT